MHLRLVHGAQPASPRARVLLVDDEPLVLDCFARMLATRFELSLAHDGLEALGQIESQPRFDAVLCDVTMPGCDGIGIHRHLLQHDPEYLERFLFITGGLLTDEIASFRQRLCHRLLEKPVTRQELTDALETVVARHRLGAASRAATTAS